jgi:tripartite-type tricarboxylate transporter receptor subunit TctC
MRALLAGLLLLAAWPAAAQPAWPDRPIRMIVPFPPGGGTDVVARVVAQRLSEALGQPVVAENRPGAGGTIGSDAVARAVPDGNTIGIATSSTHPAAPVLQKGVPYDPVRDFAAITLLGTTPYILVGGPQQPARLAEFLALVRREPGRISYASVGSTTLGYLLTRQFELLTGTQMFHVPYRGSSQAYPDLMNGTVAVLLDNPTGSAALVRDGKLRGYAVTQPSTVLPDVPTFTQAGVAGFEEPFWYGLVAPAGLPPAIAAHIQQALARHFLAAGRAELTEKDVTPVMNEPAAFASTIAADLARFQSLARRLNIQPE